jgi:hypothetical protein
MSRGTFRVVMVLVVAIACALYVPKALWPTSRFYVETLSPSRLLVIGAVAKLACLALATVYGLRSAAALDKSNPARRPWLLLSTWLGLWTIGQLTLMGYAFLLGKLAPTPSLADVTFLIGYVCLFVAQLQFVIVYRASGFPVGSARQHVLIAAIATAALAALSYVLVAPIARAEASPSEQFINIGYPLMDLAALVPTIVMIRIALAFRPGRIWTVWAALLAGFAFMAIGDFVSAYVWPSEVAVLDPWIHLTYLLGYFFAAAGMKLQHELLTESRKAID